MQLDVITQRAPAHDDLAEGEGAFGSCRRHQQLGHHSTTLGAVRIAEGDLHAALDLSDGELVEHPHAEHRRIGTQLDGDVLGDHGGETGELVVEDLRRVIGPGAPVVVAGTGVGEDREKALVVVSGEADRGGGDAARTGRRRDARQTIGIGLAHVRLTVGEDDHPPQRVGSRRALEEFDGLEPATGQIGGAAGADPRDTGDGGIGVVVREFEHEFDLIVERDDAHAIVAAGQTEQMRGGGLDRVERIAAHGAGLVEHEHDVERLPLRVRRRGRFELDEQVDDVVLDDGDDRAIEGDDGAHGVLLGLEGVETGTHDSQ